MYAERLATVESALEQQNLVLRDVQSQLERLQSREASLNDALSSTSPGVHSVWTSDGRVWNVEGGELDDVHFLIPEEHSTSTTWLLSLPTPRSLLGDYPDRYFHSLEKNSTVPIADDSNGTPSLEVAREYETWDVFADRYFSAAHCHYPVLPRHEFERMLQEQGVEGKTLESAVVLLVLALGKSDAQRAFSFVWIKLLT